ncbi:MAG: hypothetical protein IT480_06575 [Gammaproteobacteria bacterium]|nr:hypothetical protein [Gammaproteobacteria bacterium]
MSGDGADIEEQIEQAYRRMLEAPISFQRRVAGREFASLINERNAARSASEIARMETERGLR